MALAQAVVETPHLIFPHTVVAANTLGKAGPLCENVGKTAVQALQQGGCASACMQAWNRVREIVHDNLVSDATVFG